MDDQLIAAMDTKLLRAAKAVTRAIEFIDPKEGKIRVTAGGEVKDFSLKPLSQLYGEGTGLETLDPTDDMFLPLLLPIEEAIVEFWRNDPALTDAKVSLVLDELGMDPAGPACDPLKHAIQFRLRLTLSFNDYSRQDVKFAIRKIAKSVQRHTRLAGPRGYLSFMDEIFGSGSY